ncbi:dephospho-CoA kinase [soil metagenome]
MTPERTTKRIGLTGNIGSGKSTVAALLVQKGAALVDADALAREATQDPDVLAGIGSRLGQDLVVDGQLDRVKTAARVFGDKTARLTLNGIIHPWVRQRSDARVTELANRAEPPPVILLDIPLLYENGLETGLDAVIVVNAPLETRVKRVVTRSNITQNDVLARDEAQMPLAEKVRRADFVVENGGGTEELKAQIDALWAKLVS